MQIVNHRESMLKLTTMSPTYVSKFTNFALHWFGPHKCLNYKAYFFFFTSGLTKFGLTRKLE